MPMDTGQLLQQLFQVLQTTQPQNGTVQANARLQSGLGVANQLNMLPADAPFLQAATKGISGLIKYAFPSAVQQAPSTLPDAWNAISAEHNIPGSDLLGLHQAGMDPANFANIMTTDPGLGKQLLSFINGGTGAAMQATASPAATIASTMAASGTASPALASAAAPVLGASVAPIAGAAAPTGTAGILSALGITAL